MFFKKDHAIAMGFTARVISLCSYVNIIRFWKQMIEHVFTIGLISKKNNQLQTEWKIIISERNHHDYLPGMYMYMKFAMKNICYSMYWYISMIKCIKVLQVGVIICTL